MLNNKSSMRGVSMIENVGYKCVGCGACAPACKNKCIEIRPNHEGFLYPVVDKQDCVNCNLCDKVCPVLYEGKTSNIHDAEVYGIRARTDYEDDIYRSASAGVFYFLAKHIIEQGGYVFGAVFDNNHCVKHICGRSIIDIGRMQNSKYVQSDTRGVFETVKNILVRDPSAYVLFCGTPCQCLGLRAFVGEEYNHLYIVDVLCRGVPSPRAFKKYLSYLETVKKEKVQDYQFRVKHKGWNYHGYMSSYVKFNNHYWPTVCDPYMSSFLKMNDYRESCYMCPYNTRMKASDITLADFADIRDIAPDFYTKAGCSKAFVHNAKGHHLLRSIDNYIESFALNGKEIQKAHIFADKKRNRPRIRDTIYTDIDNLDDKTYVETKLKRSVSWRSVLRFYTPPIIRKALHRISRR